MGHAELRQELRRPALDRFGRTHLPFGEDRVPGGLHADPDVGDSQTVQQPLARTVRGRQAVPAICAPRSVVHTTVPAHRTSAERCSSPASAMSRTRSRAASIRPPQQAAAAWWSVSVLYRVTSRSSCSSASVRCHPSPRASPVPRTRRRRSARSRYVSAPGFNFASTALPSPSTWRTATRFVVT
ncbi:hypothetical protein [Streptomyces sp. 021-4]|uniref:hypothetical protein n=1 Tax=Streptomyces sp. 021-4 TaxID=2789260 RepID=UPI0039F5B2E9